jgi:hypothetical protein
VTVVHEAIEDRIGKRRFAEIGMPGVDGKLACDQRRAGVDAVIEDL